MVRGGWRFPQVLSMAGSRLGLENLSWRQKLGMCKRIERNRTGRDLDFCMTKVGYECSPTPNCKLAYNTWVGGGEIVTWSRGVPMPSS